MNTDPTPAAPRVDVYVRTRNVVRAGMRTFQIGDDITLDYQTDHNGVERLSGVEVIGARGVEVDGLDVKTGRPHGVGPAVGGAGTATPPDPSELIRRLSSSLQDLIENSDDPGTEALAAVFEGRQYAQTGAVYTDVPPRNPLVEAAVAAYAAAHQVPVNRVTEGDDDGIEAVRAALAAATPGEPPERPRAASGDIVPGDWRYDRLAEIVHTALFYEDDSDGPIFRWSDRRMASDDDGLLKAAADAVVCTVWNSRREVIALLAMPTPGQPSPPAEPEREGPFGGTVVGGFEVHSPPLVGDNALPMRQRHPVDPDLVDALRQLGRPYGPLGVALVAARLTEPKVLAHVLFDDRETAPTEVPGRRPSRSRRPHPEGDPMTTVERRKKGYRTTIPWDEVDHFAGFNWKPEQIAMRLGLDATALRAMTKRRRLAAERPGEA